MEIDITGARIFYTFPIEYSHSGKVFRLRETLVVRMACHDSDYRTVYLADA